MITLQSCSLDTKSSKCTDLRAMLCVAVDTPSFGICTHARHEGKSTLVATPTQKEHAADDWPKPRKRESSAARRCLINSLALAVLRRSAARMHVTLRYHHLWRHTALARVGAPQRRVPRLSCRPAQGAAMSDANRQEFHILPNAGWYLLSHQCLLVCH